MHIFHALTTRRVSRHRHSAFSSNVVIAHIRLACAVTALFPCREGAAGRSRDMELKAAAARSALDEDRGRGETQRLGSAPKHALHGTWEGICAAGWHGGWPARSLAGANPCHCCSLHQPYLPLSTLCGIGDFKCPCPPRNPAPLGSRVARLARLPSRAFHTKCCIRRCSKLWMLRWRVAAKLRLSCSYVHGVGMAGPRRKMETAR